MAPTSTLHVCADRLGKLTAVLCAATAQWGFANVEIDMVEFVTYIYNSSPASEEMVARAEGVATDIFTPAGFRVRWVSCGSATMGPGCNGPWEPTSLRVRIIRKRYDDYPGEALGYAAAGSKDLVIFYETVQILARSAITLADSHEILGITLAHEIGHLLLGPGHHSATGLMRADWSRADLEDAAKGRLQFSKEQARRMRAEIRRRARVESGLAAIR
jgi:hypothetical protein